MSETYSDCEITDETTDRSIILFSLLIARGHVLKRSRWDADLTENVIDRLDKLILEYRNPYADMYSYVKRFTTVSIPFHANGRS